MPLFGGKENIGRNIRELTEHGKRPRSHAQIVAIALSKARDTGANIPKPKNAFKSRYGK